jgi:predicted TIM-barrel enzyme
VEAITCYNNNSDVVVCHSFARLRSHGDSTLADLLCLLSSVCNFRIEDVARRLVLLFL